MSLIQLESGHIVDEDDFKYVDKPEPVNRTPDWTKRDVSPPELREVETSFGRRLVWVQRVAVFRHYASWRSLVFNGPPIDPATFEVNEPVTTAIASYDVVVHQGGTWGSSWWELAPPTQMRLFGSEERL